MRQCIAFSGKALPRHCMKGSGMRACTGMSHKHRPGCQQRSAALTIAECRCTDESPLCNLHMPEGQVLQQSGYKYGSKLDGSCASSGDGVVNAWCPVAECSSAECVVLAACACQNHWSYTTQTSEENFTFNGTCANPGGDRVAAWCPVDAGTCAHTPRQGMVVSKGPYNLCNAAGDNTTFDTRAFCPHLAAPRNCHGHSPSSTDEGLLNKAFACNETELDPGEHESRREGQARHQANNLSQSD